MTAVLTFSWYKIYLDLWGGKRKDETRKKK